jgi:hypothetical protein
LAEVFDLADVCDLAEVCDLVAATGVGVAFVAFLIGFDFSLI